jgi:hypothetical protein
MPFSQYFGLTLKHSPSLVQYSPLGLAVGLGVETSEGVGEGRKAGVGVDLLKGTKVGVCSPDGCGRNAHPASRMVALTRQATKTKLKRSARPGVFQFILLFKGKKGFKRCGAITFRR